MKEIKIYVGLNDAKMLSQKFDSAVYVSIRKRCAIAIMCRSRLHFRRAAISTRTATIRRSKR